MRMWYFPTPVSRAKHGFPLDLLSGFHAYWSPYAVGYMTRRIAIEDGNACEQLQKVGHRIEGLPILGLEEERIVNLRRPLCATLVRSP